MNDTKIHTDILKIFESIEIISKTEYTIGGLPRDISKIQVIDPYGSGEMNTSPNDSKNHAENFYKVLTTDIYNLYNAAPDEGDVLNKNAYSDDFVLLLSKANSGKGTFEEGWRVIGKDAETGKIVVKKDRLNFWVDEKNVVSENGDFSKGAKCRVKIGKEARHLNVHYYQAFGDLSKKDLPDFENKLLRFYWNLKPEGTIKYIESATRNFNREKIFFRTKVISNLSEYKRTDAGVLYIDRSQLEIAIPVIAKIHKKISKFLKNDVPMFSKKLGKGIGFAEDPANGDSFGISRSKLLAKALYESFLDDKKRKEEILETINAYFAESGIDPENPYSSKRTLMNYERIFGDLNL